MSIQDSIPIIDISTYLDQTSTLEAKARVIEEVAKACSGYGFLQIKGHGIPLTMQRQILECCKTFFDLPIQQKEAISFNHSPSRHGYEHLRQQNLDKTALPDEKEGFYIGREEPFEKGFRQGPNQWPSTLEPPIFREPVMTYYTHLQHLSRKVMELLVQGLGHPVSVLEAFTREPVMNLRLLHYPPTPPEEESDDLNARDLPGGEKPKLRFGAGEHTDFGAITLLLQQPGKQGLQVYDHSNSGGASGREGKWIAVPAVEDVLVVNIGDLVQEWTGGKYRSTRHRVIVPAGEGDRYSVPCFYEGDYRSTNPFGKSGEGETVETHIRRRFERSYGLSATA